MSGIAYMIVSVICFIVIVFFGLWTMMFLDVRRLSRREKAAREIEKLDDNGGRLLDNFLGRFFVGRRHDLFCYSHISVVVGQTKKVVVK